VERVFLGTATIKNPELVDWAIEKYGSTRIAGDIGARDGQVMVKGWQESTPLTVLEVGLHLRAQGVEWCVLTDVKRDGIGTGVDVNSAVKLQEKTRLQVVASGGVSTLEDVQRVKEAGLAGVIIGRALYEGKLSLQDVVATSVALND
jgi:phosphoribosylformimino-5-aminoimidazole carboxamide ribotide isomerase